jgi:hypothetical protein
VSIDLFCLEIGFVKPIILLPLFFFSMGKKKQPPSTFQKHSHGNLALVVPEFTQD